MFAEDTYNNQAGMMKSAGIGSGQAQLQQPSVLENLQHRKASLEMQLAKVDAAIEALTANPEIERVMTLIQKAGY